MATQRGYYKEELRRSIDNIEMALTHLARVVAAYQEAHPDIAKSVRECGDALVTVGEVITKIEERI